MATTTRRRVVATGAKLAYAAPVVAATMGLAARGASAACACPSNTAAFAYFAVTHGPNTGTCAQCPAGSGGYDQARDRCVGTVAARVPSAYVAPICDGPGPSPAP
jgi:hypothetical protein